MPGCRIVVIAQTYSAARDVCIEGDSGILSCLPPSKRAKCHWNRSLGELTLWNETLIKVLSSEKPDSARGYQAHVGWLEEFAAWRYLSTWVNEQIPYLIRLPWRPAPELAGRVVITTTPRPVKEVRDLLKDPRTVVTRGTSFENWENLSTLARQNLEKFRGTRIGRQELMGELLDDTPGALWSRALIEELRIDKAPALARIVIGVDPAITSSEDSDETGIVACGVGDTLPVPSAAGSSTVAYRYVLADRSGRYKPHEWATQAVELYRDLKADCIVAESNQGGEMVKSTIEQIDPNVPVKLIWASRGKHTRAEPVSTAYERKKVFHVGAFEKLEDEMCTWVPGSDVSPNRVDAAVHAMTELEGGNFGVY